MHTISFPSHNLVDNKPLCIKDLWGPLKLDCYLWPKKINFDLPSLIIDKECIICEPCYRRDRITYLVDYSIQQILLASLLPIRENGGEDLIKHIVEIVRKLFVLEIRPEDRYDYCSEWRFQKSLLDGGQLIPEKLILVGNASIKIESLCNKIGLKTEYDGPNLRIQCNRDDVPFLLKEYGNSSIGLYGMDGTICFYQERQDY